MKHFYLLIAYCRDICFFFSPFYLYCITLLLPVSGFFSLYILISYSDPLTIFDIISKVYFQTIIIFSFFQALLSTVLSLIGGLFLALMTVRLTSSRLRVFLLHVFSLLFVTPSIIAITAIIAAYGKEGYATSALSFFLPHTWSIYGLHGIIFAHIFFNMPLAARVFFERLQNTPIIYFYLAQNLRFNAWNIFRHIDWPSLYPTLRSLSLIIFTYCFTSFAVIMVFGGTPKYTNLELAIYQHIRFDYNIPVAATLALMQTVILFCVLILLSRYRYMPFKTPIKGADLPIYRPERYSYFAYVSDIIAFLLLLFIVIVPLLSIFLKNMNTQFFMLLASSYFWKALYNSLFIASITVILSAFICYFSLECWRSLFIHGKTRLVAQRMITFYNMCWVFTPVIISTSTFIFTTFWIPKIVYPAWWNIVIINSFFSVLLMFFLLRDRYMKHCSDYMLLSQSLGLTGWKRFKIIDYPLLRSPFYMGCAIVFVLSLGDITSVTFFRESGIITLPLYIYQLLFSYQFDLAFTACLWLIIISLGIFFIFNLLQKKSFYA